MQQVANFPLIFIVEDNPLFLKIVEEHLKLNNYNNIESFTNADECISNLHHKPHILIIDYELGTTNGLKLLNKIKNRQKQSYVIMLTKSDDVGIALEALQGGAYDYIHKDELSFRLLKTVIDKIINEYKVGIFNNTNEDMTGFKRFLKS